MTGVSTGSPFALSLATAIVVEHNHDVSVDLKAEKDPEILRKAALLLEAENRRLVAEVMDLTRKLLAATGKDRVALQVELEGLQVKLDAANRRLFGKSSERRGDGGAEKPDNVEPRKKKGHGPRAQQQLRIVVETHEMPLDTQVCEICRGDLREVEGQADQSEEIDVIAREFVVKKHVRKTYRCSCGKCIVSTPAGPRLVAGGRYSLGFAVAVAISKYADHLPLERQVRIMAREGLIVESQTLYDQIDALAKLLWPVYDRLGALLLEEPVVFADETPWPMLGKGAETARWYAWTLASPKGAYYEIHKTRGLEAGKSLLVTFKGIAVTDGYAVYEALEKRLPGLRVAQCWAHIRRKFIDCATAFPKEAEEIIGMIAELYAIDGGAPPGTVGDAERAQLRKSKSTDVLRRIQAWCVRVSCTPGSSLAQAIEYMTRRWSRATLFIEHPGVPLDNNAAERAIRGLVVGRKNHYGSKSKRGSEVAAVLYSLIESAKLAKIEPADFLRRAAEAALAGAEPLLPHELARS